MRKINVILLFLSISIISLTGCSGKGSKDHMEVSEETPGPKKITAEEAKKMMDDSEDIIILDVRAQEEYDEGHIKGAILIPDTEIMEEAEDQLKDKSATILVYCRSGRRSALAAEDLISMGYSNIYDFGGILDWPYDVVTK